MITLFSFNCNPNTENIQNKYDDFISSLQFHQLTCTCGHSACLTVHAYYYRTLKILPHPVRMRICRVRCSVCGKTHALMPAFIVPYSQISLPDQAQIVRHYQEDRDYSAILGRCPYIDENNIKSVIRNFIRHWQERLRSDTIPLTPLDDLIAGCFRHHKYQFMQIKKTVNILFAYTT